MGVYNESGCILQWGKLHSNIPTHGGIWKPYINLPPLSEAERRRTDLSGARRVPAGARRVAGGLGGGTVDGRNPFRTVQKPWFLMVPLQVPTTGMVSTLVLRCFPWFLRGTHLRNPGFPCSKCQQTMVSHGCLCVVDGRVHPQHL